VRWLRAVSRCHRRRDRQAQEVMKMKQLVFFVLMIIAVVFCVKNYVKLTNNRINTYARSITK